MAVTKVLVALSGGVDSSVCVKLLLDKGYDVAGVVMRMSDSHQSTVEAARESASALGIKLYELDLREEFKHTIIDYFADEYKSGRTPCPCINCNPKIKFKYLLKTADENGFDYIATGHYAKIIKDENGIYHLYKGESKERDQSYMLFGLHQDVLSRLLLPLFEYEKPMIREIAKEIGLNCADAPDSQENCFIEDKNYADYIERHYGKSEKGEFIAPDGTVCGEHKGIIHYTVGQRKGLGIALGRPAFITKIDYEQNRIYLGFENALVSEISLKYLSEIYDGAIKDGMRCEAKLRSAGIPIPCQVKLDKSGENCTLIPDSPQKKVPSGQGGCLYSGNEILGGGIIS